MAVRSLNTECLDASNNTGYGCWSIPHLRDDEIASFLCAWIALEAENRRVISQAIDDNQRPTLLAFSERMASRSVRERDDKWIVLGIVSLGVDDWRLDYRDNVPLLCLHYHACQQISVSPDWVFSSAASVLSPRVQAGLISFLERSPEDKSLSAMGYEESSDAGGFRYKRTW